MVPKSNALLVLVHGAQHGPSYWSGLDLGCETRAVALGTSRWTPIADLVTTLRTAIADVQSPIVFVGHSQGALVVQSHLATGGTGAAAVLMAPVPLDTRLYAEHAVRLARKVPLTSLARSLVTLNAKHVLAPDVETTQANFFLPSTPNIADYFATQITPVDTAIAGLRCRGNAKDIHIPILILAAEHDRLVDRDILTRLTEVIPNSDLHVVPQQAHAFRDPDWQATVAKPILAFLQRFSLLDGTT